MAPKRQRPLVAIFDGDSRFCQQAAHVLSDRCEVEICSTEAALQEILRRREPDLLLFDVEPAAGGAEKRNGFEVVSDLRSSGPKAMGEAKALVREMIDRPGTADKVCVETIARLRVGAEGQEGLHAFLEKRKPRWSKA